jgi:hypothetical protein
MRNAEPEMGDYGMGDGMYKMPFLSLRERVG